MSARYCVGCGRPRQVGEYGCPACGSDVYDDVVAGCPAPRGERSPDEELGGVLLDLAWLPPGQVGLVKGPRGSGKSSIALGCLRRPWICSSEMGIDEWADYSHRLRAPMAGYSEIEVGQDEDGPTLDLRVRDTSADVLIDSITATKHPQLCLEVAKEHARVHRVRVLLISQVTLEGNARGGSTLEHDCKLLIGVYPEGAQRRVVVEKSRFGPEGSRLFELDAGGARLPTMDRYYSVEGKAPHYKLVPWPSSGRFADVYRQAEALLDEDGPGMPLPPPPLAVTARRSSLYGSGWIEPGDVDARARFAATAGVPHWSPTPQTFPRQASHEVPPDASSPGQPDASPRAQPDASPPIPSAR